MSSASARCRKPAMVDVKRGRAAVAGAAAAAAAVAMRSGPRHSRALMLRLGTATGSMKTDVRVFFCSKRSAPSARPPPCPGP